jgi:hypothetical protein
MKQPERRADMPLSTILEISEHDLDEEEWDDEGLGAEDEDLDLDELDDDFEEDDGAAES